MLRPSRV